MHAKDKFIAFIDIVGFTAMVEAAEADGGDFTRPFELAAELGSPSDEERIRTHGPWICPNSAKVAKDVNFRITQISDCVVASAEISPAGVISLINHCFGAAITLLTKNALCRGYVTRGQIHHEAGQFIGTGYMQAVAAEKGVSFLRVDPNEGGTPFIQIDDAVVEYVREHTDPCVRMMFDRMTRSDGTYTAVYPFKAIAKSPSSIIDRNFDAQAFLETVRRSIGYRQRDLETLRAAELAAPHERDKAKIRHYMRGMEEVLESLRIKEQNVIKLAEEWPRPKRP